MWSDIQTLYRKLLALYPRSFREQFGESMEQTFTDLYNESRRHSARGWFVLSVFTETAIGIGREHMVLLVEGDAMRTMFASPRFLAIMSLLLSLPLGLIFVVFTLDIDPLVKFLNKLFTVNGQQGDINTLGRFVYMADYCFYRLPSHLIWGHS